MKCNLSSFVCACWFLLSFSMCSPAQWERTHWLGGLGTNSYGALTVSGPNLLASVSADGDGGGLFLSTDQGASWKEIDSATFRFSHIYVFFHDKTNLFIGSGKGTYISLDSGVTWTKINSPTNTYGQSYVTAITACGLALFVGTMGDGIFRSNDGGTTWLPSNAGLPSTDQTAINALVNKNDTLFAATDTGVSFSPNMGLNWFPANTGIVSTNGSSSVSSLLVKGINLFAGTTTGGLYVSNNSGRNWTESNVGIAVRYFASLLCVGNNIIAGTGGNGVFLSSDDGASWTALNSGVPKGDAVWSLASSDTYVFAGTFNDGVWRLPISQLAVDNPRQKSTNPYATPFFNVSTAFLNAAVCLSLPYSGRVNVDLFDCAGSHLAAICNNQLPAGIHRILFNTSHFSSGFYTIKVQTGSFVACRNIPLYH